MSFNRSKSTLEYPPYARFQPQAIGSTTWLEMLEIYRRLIEDPNQKLRLLELMGRAGLGTNLDVLNTKFYQADSLRTLRLYQRMNPRINLANLAKEDPFDVIAGLLSIL
jgi:hypothetical protein